MPKKDLLLEATYLKLKHKKLNYDFLNLAKVFQLSAWLFAISLGFIVCVTAFGVTNVNLTLVVTMSPLLVYLPIASMICAIHRVKCLNQIKIGNDCIREIEQIICEIKEASV